LYGKSDLKFMEGIYKVSLYSVQQQQQQKKLFCSQRIHDNTFVSLSVPVSVSVSVSASVFVAVSASDFVTVSVSVFVAVSVSV